MTLLARITLLLLWLFAITAPSIITLCDDENPIVITNLNEEEQDTGKKSLGEEKFVKESYLDFSLVAGFKSSIISNIATIGYLNLSLEVLSPPPDKLG